MKTENRDGRPAPRPRADGESFDRCYYRWSQAHAAAITLLALQASSFDWDLVLQRRHAHAAA